MGYLPYQLVFLPSTVAWNGVFSFSPPSQFDGRIWLRCPQELMLWFAATSSMHGFHWVKQRKVSKIEDMTCTPTKTPNKNGWFVDVFFLFSKEAFLRFHKKKLSGCNDELVNYSDSHAGPPKDLETVNSMLSDQLETGCAVV